MFENREGQTVPEVTFKVIEDGAWKDVTTDDLFKGKKVIVFSLPGAFTPTCSSAHLPRYNELAGVFAENGVDDILCVSVNDTFVMNAWAKDQNAGNITMVPDGNGEFTKGMGLLVDKTAVGFGPRSWRYSMLVEDKVVKKMFIEPDKPGDPYEVSDADTMLGYLNPAATKPRFFSLITKPGCPFCAKSKSLLESKGMKYEELVLGTDISVASMKAISGRESTPQIFLEGKHIGGSDDLEAWFSNQ